MVKAYKAVGLLEPEYGTDGTFVWITFKRPNSVTDSVTNSVTNFDVRQLSDKQKEVLAYCIIVRSSREILEHINVSYQYKNRMKFIISLIEIGLLERTIPEVPNSPLQKYVAKGR